MTTHTRPSCDGVRADRGRCRYRAIHSVDVEGREVRLCQRHHDRLADLGEQQIVGWLGEFATVTSTRDGYRYEVTG